MSKVRIIRVLEYTFEDQEAADLHIGLLKVPLNGHVEFGPHSDPAVIIRSSGNINLAPIDVPD